MINSYRSSVVQYTLTLAYDGSVLLAKTVNCAMYGTLVTSEYIFFASSFDSDDWGQSSNQNLNNKYYYFNNNIIMLNVYRKLATKVDAGIFFRFLYNIIGCLVCIVNTYITI